MRILRPIGFTLYLIFALAPFGSAAEIDLARLREVAHLGVTVFYPTYIPSRFSASPISIDSEQDAEGKPHFDYALEFCDKKRLCFDIESAWCGIGDGPDGDRRIGGTSPVFGRFSIEVFNPGSEGNGTAERYYLSQWLDEKRAKASAQKIGCPSDGPQRHYLLLGNGISDKEAIAIVKSLKAVE